MQLINEVQNAQILLDTCVYASPAPNVLSRPVDGGRRILRAAGMGGGATLNHPPARPRFGCIVSPLHAHASTDEAPLCSVLMYY
jgi:hypothetical protein